MSCFKLFRVPTVTVFDNRIQSEFIGDCLMAVGFITKYKCCNYRQHYLSKPSSRVYFSAMPTKALLADFSDTAYKPPNKVWDNYDWSIQL